MCVCVGLLFPPFKAFFSSSLLAVACFVAASFSGSSLLFSLPSPQESFPKNEIVLVGFFSNAEICSCCYCCCCWCGKLLFFQETKKKEAFLVAYYALTHQSFFHCCRCECRCCFLCYELFGFGLCLVCLLLFRNQSVKGFSFCGVFAFTKCF